MISTARTHRRAGYATIVHPGRGGVKEMDTCTCRHCNRVWCTRSNDPAQETSLGGFCRQCMAMICDPCVGKPCTTIEQKMLEMEARDRFNRSLSEIA